MNKASINVRAILIIMIALLNACTQPDTQIDMIDQMSSENDMEFAGIMDQQIPINDAETMGESDVIDNMSNDASEIVEEDSAGGGDMSIAGGQQGGGMYMGGSVAGSLAGSVDGGVEVINEEVMGGDMSVGGADMANEEVMGGDMSFGGGDMGNEEVMGGDQFTGGIECEESEEDCNEDQDCNNGTAERSCPNICGNGVIEDGEECDQGMNNSSAPCPYGDLACERCSEQCTRILPEYCGDGRVNGAESCEMDQLSEGILCTHECKIFDCGGSALNYTPLRVQGWPVCVANELIAEDPDLYQEVIAALDEDLVYIAMVLPSHATQRLKQVNIWIEMALEQFPGGVYHPNPRWLVENGYPEEWALGIQIGNAQNYMTWVREQPAIILHELTHAWHHQVLTYSYRPIIDAYQAAMNADLYQSVQYVYGQYLTAYATNNIQEYFAELTEAWFWTNDYYPFNRQALQMYDPTGASMIEEAWQN